MVAVMTHSLISIVRELGDSASLWCGTATAADMISAWSEFQRLFLPLLTVTVIDFMDVSRPSSPEAPPQDLWSSILDSVSSSRSIPSKQVLLLGQPSSGKSTIVSALLQKPASDEERVDQRSDFALGYDFADVRDDADEGESIDSV